MILDKAKKLAEDERNELNRKQDEQRKEEARKEKLLNTIKGEFRVLIEELNGKEGFTIKNEITTPNFKYGGYFAELYHDYFGLIGAFYVNWDQHEFFSGKGREEGYPDRVEDYLKIGFQETKELGNRNIYVENYLGGFDDKFANYLKKFL